MIYGLRVQGLKFRLTRLPLTELSDVKALKRRLHQHHGLPPRFRQRLFNNGEILDDDFQLDSAMDLQVLIVSFCDASQDQRRELCAAAMDGRLAEAGSWLTSVLSSDSCMFLLQLTLFHIS